MIAYLLSLLILFLIIGVHLLLYVLALGGLLMIFLDEE